MNQEINPNGISFLLSKILTEITAVKEDIGELRIQEKKIYEVEKEVSKLLMYWASNRLYFKVLQMKSGI